MSRSFISSVVCVGAQKHWASWHQNMKDGFPRPTQRQISEVFENYIDMDANGQITDQEILTFTTRLLEMERKAETGNELSDWDIDSDGRLTLAEVLEGMSLNGIDEDIEKDPVMRKFFEEDQNGATAKFFAADKNKDHFLDQEELLNFIYPELDPDTLHVEVSHQILIKDRNNDNKISLSEFREVEVDDQDVSHDLYNAELSEFRMYDRNLDQHLDREEVEGMINGMTYSLDRIRDFMYIVDTNGDNKINIEELNDAYERIALHDTISEIFWYKQEVAQEHFEMSNKKDDVIRQEL